LLDDLAKFVSELASPPQLVKVLEEGRAKTKERRKVGEGDDTVIVEDSSEEDDDEEMLQERFQLRSRFSRPGLPHIPLIQDPPTNLEASLPVPPRKPRNVPPWLEQLRRCCQLVRVCRRLHEYGWAELAARLEYSYG
jgi:hypothetical protein